MVGWYVSLRLLVGLYLLLGDGGRGSPVRPDGGRRSLVYAGGVGGRGRSGVLSAGRVALN